jgi:sigma-B regulation protein RsbU (phosphoserine phosphatase)
VILASNGEEGLAKALELRPALIICDWLMPGITGLEVCRQVKVTPQLSTTFFILLTSLGSVEDRVKGLDAGADDFLCKPIEMYELRARIRAGLRLHQLSHDLQVQKHLLEAELAEAADYVCSVLPEPLNDSAIAIDVRFIPSRQLGGDGFDYYWLDSEHLALYLLDVSGHGLRAALPSLSVLNLLRSRSLNNIDYYHPKEVLEGLNKLFQMTPRNDKYFTIWYGVYHLPTQELVYGSAGHPPALLITPNSDGEMIATSLRTRGLPIGMFAEADYTEAKIKINADSRLYVFSDGIYELDQPDGTIWGLENFTQLLKEYQKQSQRGLDYLIQTINRWNAQDNFDDDISIIQVNFF